MTAVAPGGESRDDRFGLTAAQALARMESVQALSLALAAARSAEEVCAVIVEHARRAGGPSAIAAAAWYLEPTGRTVLTADEDGAAEKPLGARLLVCDDEGPLLSLVAQLLGEAGHEVAAFTDPEQALAFAADLSRPVDALITDMLMRGMSGRELAAAVLVQRPGLPVVFMSGYAPDVSDPSRRPPGSVLLDKPFDVADLLHALDGLLRPGVTSA